MYKNEQEFRDLFMLRNHNRHWGNFFADDEDVFPEDEKRIDFYSGIIIIPVSIRPFPPSPHAVNGVRNRQARSHTHPPKVKNKIKKSRSNKASNFFPFLGVVLSSCCC